MFNKNKLLLLSTCFISAGFLSGCLGSVLGALGMNNGRQYSAYQQNPYNQNPYQQPYQQAYNSQGNLNQQGNLNYQGTLQQQGALQQGLMGQGQGLSGQNQAQGFQPSTQRGYSDSGYQPGYPANIKRSYVGWGKQKDTGYSTW
jgi:hypothetical protein